MRIEGFDWDSGNTDKCQKHGLVKKEIEWFFTQEKIYVAPDIKHSSHEERFLAIREGPKNKLIVVAFTFRIQGAQTLIRPISARFMNKKEVQKYEETFKKNKNR